jgi:sugar-specific transcriptional regulator TrmB
MSLADDSGELVVGLQGFGLTEYESRVYYALLSNGACTVNQIQYASGVPRTKVYQVAQQLTRKGLLREVEGGKPSKFEAQPPEVLQSILVERERKVRSLRKSMVALKKVREKNVNPGDVTEERYLSFGSQSLLMKLKESILKAEKEVKCIVDNWGLHLIQECIEEVESACRHDTEVRIVSSLTENRARIPVLLTQAQAEVRQALRRQEHLRHRQLGTDSRQQPDGQRLSGPARRAQERDRRRVLRKPLEELH